MPHSPLLFFSPPDTSIRRESNYEINEAGDFQLPLLKKKVCIFFFFAALMLPFFSGFDAGEVKIFNGLPPPPPTFVLCPVFVVSQIPFPLSLPWMIIRRTPRGVPWKKKKRKKLYKKNLVVCFFFFFCFLSPSDTKLESFGQR